MLISDSVRRPSSRLIRASLLIAAIGLLTLAVPVFSSGRDADSEKRDSDARRQITRVLEVQKQAWNDGDINAFMSHYWKSDELTFSSGGQIVRGWDATLKRYRDRYPTSREMGKLDFDQLEVTLLGESAALVLGHWELQRDPQPVGGSFSIVLRRFDGRWLIIHDHTSVKSE